MLRQFVRHESEIASSLVLERCKYLISKFEMLLLIMCYALKCAGAEVFWFNCVRPHVFGLSLLLKSWSRCSRLQVLV